MRRPSGSHEQDGWRDRPQWRVLALGSGAALEFLRTWHAWRHDAHRPQRLHFVAVGDPLDGWVAGADEFTDLATHFAECRWGLTPGFHRLAFEHGHVLLTWCVGPADAMLREQRFAADAILLGASGDGSVLSGDAQGVKALARRCRRGTRITAPDLPLPMQERFARGGFVVDRCGENFSAVFDPGWTPRVRPGDDPARPVDAAASPAPALVIGGGIAGAAVAASLARRGHEVRVLDAAGEPAGGASGLPAGLLAPHVSADDNALSRLSRAGLRQTLQFAQERLVPGVDWTQSGVLEVRSDAMHVLGRSRSRPMREWSEAASDGLVAAAGLGAATPAVWHRRAGWIKPKALVRALLAHDRIEWQGGANVARLLPGQRGWQAVDAQGRSIAESGCVVIAAGDGSRELVPGSLPLRSIRGQLSLGTTAQQQVASACAAALPPFPVNGDGSLLPNVPLGPDRCWIAGATYERNWQETAGDDPFVPHPAGHAANLERLRRLLPHAAARLAPCFADAGAVRGWAGMRCAAPDRLPVVGNVAAGQRAGLWISSAMGSRGLTFALLCAELLAARMHAEPLPVEARLARMLDVRRLGGDR